MHAFPYRRACDIDRRSFTIKVRFLHWVLLPQLTLYRPHCNEQALSIETETGRPFRLDESLFERMMSPSMPAASSLPTSSLAIQRRMHPEIANLVRLTLYPKLKVRERAIYLKPNPDVFSRIMSRSGYIHQLQG